MDVDARVASRDLIPPGREQVASVHGTVEHHPHGGARYSQRNERRWHVEESPRGHLLQRLKAGSIAEALRLVAGDESCEPAIQQQTAQGDDERLQPESGDQQAME